MPPDVPFDQELFVLRLWREELGDDRQEWRGALTHVRSGEVRYFRDARTLQAMLWRMLVQEFPEQDWGPDHV